MALLQVPTATLSYDLVGTGSKHLILVNGHMRTKSDFRLMAKHFAERGYSVLSFDNRGAGETVSTAPFDLTTMADDVAALAKHVGFGCYALLGISMGGLISMRHAKLYAKSVRKLALVSTTAQPKWILPANHGTWGTTIEDVAVKIAMYLAPDFAARNKLLVQAMAKQIHAAIESGKFLDQVVGQRHVVDGSDVREEAKTLAVPTVILHGEKDRIISVDAARELATLIPNAELCVAPEVGHLFLAENPKFLYEKVLGFLDNDR